MASIRRVWRRVPLLSALLLIVVSMMTYGQDSAVPGNHGRFPAGWWGWWDQSQYILSARSLAHLDLTPDHHWYPIGYALLGAPFTFLSTLHPYLLPDLACLLATFFAFLVFARAVDVGAPAAALLFSLACAGSPTVRQIWAEPWNTTLSTALIWSLLALTAQHLFRPAVARTRALRFVAMGAVAGFMPVTRPTDALLVLIWFAGMGTLALSKRDIRLRDILWIALGGLLTFLPAAALWLAIHGMAPSGYMRNSAALGFNFGNLGWRAYLLLISPQPWFPEGQGLLLRLPWLLPGIVGMMVLPWIKRGRQRFLLIILSAMILSYGALFCAYVDLIPSGLWTYLNVHYFKWTFPGMVLLGWIVLRESVAGPWFGRRLALVAAASLATVCVCLFRVMPRLDTDSRPAAMVQLLGPTPGWDESYFGTIHLHDGRGDLQVVKDFRALPDRFGWRLIALSRPFEGAVVVSGLKSWPEGVAVPASRAAGSKRWRTSVGIWNPFHRRTSHE